MSRTPGPAQALSPFSDFPLDGRLLKALDKLGFDQATPVQQQVIPLALAQKDLLISAETGSGKTAAFLLPALHRLLRHSAPNSATRMLVLLPTRELARQTLKHAKQLAAFTHLQSGLICGGETFKYQRALFRKNPEIIVATPGRLLEHLEQGTPDFDDLEILVLDEADRMLDMGLREDVLKIVACCNKNAPGANFHPSPEGVRRRDASNNGRQTLLLSATLNHRGLAGMTEALLREPEVVRLGGIRDPHRNIRQQIVLADDRDHKARLAVWLLEHEAFEKALVFTNTKAQADSLGLLLRRHELRAGVLHGDLDQEERNRIMTLLRQGGINVLVATDVAARGLDVKGIDLVINFDMARSGKEHVHRIGRTGRGEKEGLAVCLISPQEWNLMSAIGRYLRLQFERRTIEALTAKYKGPKKLKSSGKAAGSKKRKQLKRKAADKAKQRHRNRKNIGKRRAPKAEPAAPGTTLDGGSKPLMKKG